MTRIKSLNEPQVKLRRRTGPDHRVHKSDVENLMKGKLLLPKLSNESGHNITNRVNINP